jgi:enediyne biosynthesis protein E4
LKKKLLILILLLNTYLCYAQQFSILPSSYTHVGFRNLMANANVINFFNYEYLYNGAGVAIGDLNNDNKPDIVFTGNLSPNAIYINKGAMDFKDITATSNLQNYTGYYTGVSLIDINNDGWLDIYFCKSALLEPSKRKNELFINNKNETFTESAEQYGLADESYSTQAYWADMDLDGDIDMYLVNHPKDMTNAKKMVFNYGKDGKLTLKENTDKKYHSDRYYENIKGKYVDKTESAGLSNYAFGLSAVVQDFNNDAYPDIYVANDYLEPDYLYINNKNGTFTQSNKKYFKHVSYNSMGSDYADINNDGFDDLIVLDMLPDLNYRQKQFKQLLNYDQYDMLIKYNILPQFVKNVLHLSNNGEGFSDISYHAGIAFTDWSWAPLIMDFDNDGNKDLYITNGIYKDITDLDFLKFNSDSIIKSMTNKTDPKFNMDTAMKLLSSVQVANYYFKNDGKLKFIDQTFVAGVSKPSFSSGAAYADLDGDGDMDIVVNNVGDEAFIIQNNARTKTDANYIQFKYNSALWYGTKIKVTTANNVTQTIVINPTKGYLSQHQNLIHFGIGNFDKCKVEYLITNKDGTYKIINAGELKANTTNELSNNNATTSIYALKPAQKYKNIAEQIGLNYLHKENEYIDYKLEPLLPKRYSQQGPAIAVADANNDGLQDLFIGGAKNESAQLWLQNKEGNFVMKTNKVWEIDKLYEDVNAKFFDADKDGDNDLIVVSGGNDYGFELNKYPARLYINNGKAEFTKATNNTFPNLTVSAKAIAVGDYDGDKDLDIFIGGRIVPGRYGDKPTSYLLKNENGKFVLDNNQAICNKPLGMITDAMFTDFNKDGALDLVVVGEWMPLSIFINKNNKFEVTPFEVQGSNGWWNCITQLDINKDGKEDFLLGNLGANSRYKASSKEPINMYAKDFDNNGSMDALLTMFIGGQNSPLAMRDNLCDQMPILKKKFKRYTTYSSATITDIASEEALNTANKYTATYFKNSMFINEDGTNFYLKALPNNLQLFPIQGFAQVGTNQANTNTLLIIGNDYSTEIESGRNDACIGMEATVDNQFNWTFNNNNGFYVPGDARAILPITIAGSTCWVVAQNQGQLLVYKQVQ